MYCTCRPFYGSGEKGFGYGDDRVVVAVFMVDSFRTGAECFDATAATTLIERVVSTIKYLVRRLFLTGSASFEAI